VVRKKSLKLIGVKVAEKDKMEPRDIRIDIRERVMRIETIVERMESHLLLLNNRTAKLENWKAWSAGGFASLGLIITLMKIGII
jgi:hypothetical protein|tara:strand:+ start:141 stop:392 length:252 start_codon:yes stop_codon:yes gene_type:complete